MTVNAKLEKGENMNRFGKTILLILFDNRIGPPGEFLRIGTRGDDQRKH
jgi:hypothetical protein